jgi:hypothetical protein
MRISISVFSGIKKRLFQPKELTLKRKTWTLKLENRSLADCKCQNALQAICPSDRALNTSGAIAVAWEGVGEARACRFTVSLMLKSVR